MVDVPSSLKAALLGGALFLVPTGSLAQDSVSPSPEEDVIVPQEAEAAARLLAFVTELDGDAELQVNGALFTVEDVQLQLVFDLNADRMRLLTPIAPADDIPAADLVRMMQANFDSALDARYGIAQGALWATFIHPLASLTMDDFASGIGQTVNLVRTYGTTYSSGALVFGGGDSAEENRQLIDELIQRGREI
ncbi:MAG: type III secretion system chaperone [Pseudomonadota bacterium]